jgi:hypothetical protein
MRVREPRHGAQRESHQGQHAELWVSAAESEPGLMRADGGLIRGDYHPSTTIRYRHLHQTVAMPLSDAHDGLAEARYTFESRANDGLYIYRLQEVVEFLPPLPPQLRGFGDDIRLPMMENGAFSVHLEAERRRKEWAEYDARPR